MGINKYAQNLEIARANGKKKHELFVPEKNVFLISDKSELRFSVTPLVGSQERWDISHYNN